MPLVNHTPFPALAFEGVDQQQQGFHVVVLRQTLVWNDAAELSFAETQAALCEADEFFEGDLQGSARQESDLCPYKPRCDVIVNATAYAPSTGAVKPPSRFAAQLVVRRPDSAAPLPRAPQGLNPFMHASAEDTARWRRAVTRAKQNPLRGERLIDKTLTVTGERFFARRNVLFRASASVLKLATLGLVRMQAWRLTAPRSVRSLPLRLTVAYGGQARIEPSERAAAKVPKPHRLSADREPTGDQPVAHDAFAANPIGTGYAPAWYLKATGTARVAAPRIEFPDRPITLRDFKDSGLGKPAAHTRLVAGFGVRPKGHPERAALAGTFDADFAASDRPLPDGFDFGVWNAAWPDQQVDDLRGDEVIELRNLCESCAPGARPDAHGNTLLRLTLPGHLPFVLVRYHDGSIGELSARLDTLLIDTDQRRLSLVWRATLAKQPAVRALEARMLSRPQRVALEQAAVTAAEPQGAPAHG